MTFNPLIHHRKSIRLKDYDYSKEGLYFITFCCQNRRHLFGEIISGKMMLNDAGKIAEKCWLEIPDHFKNVILHDFVIMPNHVHGIIEFKNNDLKNDTVGANQNSPKHVSCNDTETLQETYNVSCNGANIDSPRRMPKSPSKTIGSVIRGYKIGVTKWMRQNTNVTDVWQRNYYEHIIRNDIAYCRISDYIKNNPKKWDHDNFFKK
jgi:putative transposase